MNVIFRIQCETAITSICNTKYSGIAFDGKWFYLLKQNKNEIVKLDDHFEPIECFYTCRNYKSISYDPNSKTFWAISNCRPTHLYQLDKCFKEINTICLSCASLGVDIGTINSISYDCKEEYLLLGTSRGIAWVNICDNHAKLICFECLRHSVTGIVSAGENFFYSFLCDNKQFVRYCCRDGEILWEKAVPHGLLLCSGVFGFEDHCDRECRLFVLANKCGRYPYILQITPCKGCFCDGLCCYDKRPRPTTDSEVINSVASIQYEIARVIKTLAKELHEVIESSDSPEQIIEANNNVSRTLNEITMIEVILQQKLLNLGNLCCEEDQPM